MPIVLAGFAAFIVALVALIAIFGLAKMADILTRPLTGIPVIGLVRSAILHGIGAAVTFWSPWLKMAATSITTWIRSLWQHHSTTNVKAQTAVGALAGRLYGVVHHDIPAATEALTHKVGAIIYRDAVQWRAAVTAEQDARVAAVHEVGLSAEHSIGYWHDVAEHDIALERAQRAAEVATVAGKLQSEIDQLAKAAEQSIGYTRTLSADQLAQLRAEILTQLRVLGDYVSTATGQAAQYAKTAAGQAETNAVGYANASAAAAVAGLWPGIVGPANGARAGVAAEAPGVIDGAPAIPQVAPTTLAGTLAAVATMAATATTFVDECGLGLCSGLGTVARLLNGIADAGLVAALVAIATEALHNPDGATTAMRDLAQGPADAVLPVVGAMFGVRLSVP